MNSRGERTLDICCISTHKLGNPMSPLSGKLVLDFSTLLPGPMATLLLAEAGAEVIKIERPPLGEEMRSYDPQWGHDSVNFALLNRGKKSLSIDLKNEQDRDRLTALIARADVIVEQFRPGVMARLGLDYDSVTKVNPTVIYCSITGFGQSGPKCGIAAHDLNYMGDSGLLSLSHGSPDHPVLPPALIADIAGGAYPAVINVLLALQQRERDGQGRYLDIAMTDNLMTFMYWALGKGLATGDWPGNGTDLVTGASPRYNLYPARDGRMIAVAAIENKFWNTFCGLVGLEPVFADDSRNPAATKRRVGEIIALETSEVWRTRFAGQDCCCSVVANASEAIRDEHFAARGLFDYQISNDDGQVLPALPVPVARVFRAPPSEPVAAPRLGRDNDEYLRPLPSDQM